MATFKGPFKYKGRIGNIRYYEVPGDDRTYAAERGCVPKAILDESPVFARSRKTRDEFTPKSKCAKDIRRSFADWAQPIVNRQLHAKLVSVMNDIVLMDKVNDSGIRAIYLSRYKDLLYNVDYHFIRTLSEILKCPYTLAVDDNRKTVTIILKGLNPSKHIKAPVTASHFQLCLSMGTVQDYTYDKFWNRYEPILLNNKNISRQTLHPWIPVDSGLMGDITLTVSLPDAFVVGDDISVLRAFGIVFGRMTGEVVPLKKDRGSIVFLGAV